jgi:hypothetical protein
MLLSVLCCLVLLLAVHDAAGSDQKSSSVVKTNCSNVIRSPLRLDMTPAF